MAWPSWRDFNDAVQDPRSCFADADLWGEATTDAMGLPKVCSGNFAVVYQMHAADKSQDWAVKCFTRPAADRQRRYREISAHLQRTGLPFTVAFTYQEEGIRVRGSWYPIVKMDWVKGLTLTQFVRGSLDRPGVLEVLSQVWLKLAQRLRHALVTHGDLQHGNVLLVQGSTDKKLALKLVDYDGMWVPALAGKVPSGELGLPAYQHPQRARDNVYGSKVDRFSQLVIFTALRALRLQGEALWQRFDTGENLLFTARDFAAPGASELLRELWDGHDGDLRHLAGRLILAAQAPLAETPELNDVAGEDSVKLLNEYEQAQVKQIMTGAIAVQAVPTPVLAGVENGRANAMPAWLPTPAAQEDALVHLAKVNIVGAKPFNQPGEMVVAVGRKRNRWHLAIAGGVLFLACLFLVVGLAIKQSSEKALSDRAKVDRRLAEEKVAENVRKVAKDTENLRKLAEDKEAENLRKLAENEKAARKLAEDKEADNVRKLAEQKKAENKRKLAKDENARKKFQAFEGHAREVSSVAFSPDGKYLASASYDRTVKVWDAHTGKEIRTFSLHTHGVARVAFNPNGKNLASVGVNETVMVWDPRTGIETPTFSGRIHGVTGVAFSPDGKNLACASPDKTVKIWDARTGQDTLTLKGHTAGVIHVAFSRDGKRLASASHDKTVKVWDIRDIWDARTEATLTLIGHTQLVASVAFSPDGNRLASTSLHERTVRIWDAHTGKQTSPLAGHAAGINSVVFSLDGKRLATASHDKTVKVWDAQTGQVILTFKGHTAAVVSVAFSPDGKRVASGSHDTTMKVWDVQNGEEDFSFKQDGLVRTMAFGRVGSWLLRDDDGQTPEQQ